MNRTITVKGTGKISKAPDQIALSLEIERRDPDYDKTAALANRAMTHLTVAVKGAGLDEKDLRTQSYRITADYDSVKDANGNYQRIFSGYLCCIRMILRFPLDMKKLGLVLHTISACKADPEISIKFQLADEDAAKDEMLIAATQDAHKKAKLLTTAAGVELGDLQSIQYAWDEIHFESKTDYFCDIAALPSATPDMDITPEDVERSDTAVFVWEIK